MTERGAPTPLFVRRSIVRLDRRTHQPHELFSATGLDTAIGQPASQGIAVTGGGVVYFGQGHQLMRVSLGSPARVVASFPTTSRVTSWPAIGPDSSVAIVVTDGTLSSIEVVRPSGDVVRLAHLQPTTPGATGFGYLEADGAGNVFTLQRIPHDFGRFTCASSTTIRLLRIDGDAVRSSAGEVAPTEIASITESGHLGLFIGSNDYFRVSRKGEVFFGVYPFVPFCPPAPLPPFPLSNQAAARRLLAFSPQADGTYSSELLMDAAGVPAGTFFAGFLLAVRNSHAVRGIVRRRDARSLRPLRVRAHDATSRKLACGVEL